jgi:hypothetical protein
MYKIEYEYNSCFEDFPRKCHVELTTKQLTGDRRNLAIRLRNEILTFSSRKAETRAANRLRVLIKQIAIGIPNSWNDHSQTCDGWSEDLKIEFGSNVLRFHWFCDYPQEWSAINALAREISSIANKLKK